MLCTVSSPRSRPRVRVRAGVADVVKIIKCGESKSASLYPSRATAFPLLYLSRG